MDVQGMERVNAAAENAEHARLILETANDAFVSIDGDGVVIDWNGAAERIFGWHRDEALGRELSDLMIPPRYHAAHRAGLARYVRTGESQVLFHTLELTALHRDGHEFPVELTIWPSHVHGRLRFNAFLRDVTERARMHDHLRLLQEVTAAANAATELEEAMVAALEGVAELTGWPVGHAYVRGWDDDELSPTGWWTRGASRFDDFRVDTEARGFSEGVGLPGRVAVEGRPMWSSPLADDDNFPRRPTATACGLVSGFAFPVVSEDRVVAVLEFYSERRERPDDGTLELMHNIGIQLGRVFERLRWRAQLREAIDTKSRLMSMMAHELRTPLVAIEGFSGMLLEDLPADQDDRMAGEALRGIVRHTRRLQRLITQALTAATLDAGQQKAEIEPVELRPVIDQVVADLQLTDVVEIRADEPVWVRFDPDHLVQVLTNYLDNARGYGEPPITVTVERPAAGGRPAAVVRVRDHGPGVPAHFVPELFRSFRRAGGGGGGAGLGLSIVRELAELNHAAVWHEPARPSGACFALRLPVDPSSIDRTEAAPAPGT